MALIIKRGDIVVCAISGDYGKPRPALVVQSDLFNPTHASITVCPITSHLIDTPLFRVSLLSNADNGLRKNSQVMIDKIVSIRREKIQEKIGQIKQSQLQAVTDALMLWLS